MKYSVIRKEIKSGDIAAFRNTSFVGKFIRSWTGSSYSHIGICVKLHGRNFILQDKERHGVQLVTASSAGAFDLISTNAEWTEDVEQFAFESLGQSYSYVNAILAGFNVPPVGKDRICSEYALEILQKTKIINLTENIYTPGQLVNCLLDLGFPLQKVTPI